jgi:hypothetical protein
MPHPKMAPKRSSVDLSPGENTVMTDLNKPWGVFHSVSFVLRGEMRQRYGEIIAGFVCYICIMIQQVGDRLLRLSA